MSVGPIPALPPRRSIAAWAVLAAVLIVGFYTLTLALATACVYFPYLFLTAQSGGSLQFILLFVCGLVMAGTMLWSLVPRREKFTPPGPRLEAARHPRLFAEIGRLAGSLNEPPPQQVYLIPDVNAFVGEPPGAGGRIMGLGLPLLQILTVSRFRAVLAHEFGHYYSGDTRLGPWVYKARTAMVRTLLGLGRPNPALRVVTRFLMARMAHYVVTHILVAYWKLFLRITQRVSRRQELRADELACALAGSRALIEGLQDIHRDAAALAPYLGELGRCLPRATVRPLPKVLHASYPPATFERRWQRTWPRSWPTRTRSRLTVILHCAIAWRQPAACPPAKNRQNDPPAISLIEDVPTLEAELLQKLNPKQKVESLKLRAMGGRCADDLCAGMAEICGRIRPAAGGRYRRIARREGEGACRDGIEDSRPEGHALNPRAAHRARRRPAGFRSLPRAHCRRLGTALPTGRVLPPARHGAIATVSRCS